MGGGRSAATSSEACRTSSSPSASPASTSRTARTSGCTSSSARVWWPGSLGCRLQPGGETGAVAIGWQAVMPSHSKLIPSPAPLAPPPPSPSYPPVHKKVCLPGQRPLRRGGQRALHPRAVLPVSLGPPLQRHLVHLLGRAGRAGSQAGRHARVGRSPAPPGRQRLACIPALEVVRLASLSGPTPA